MQIVQNYIMVMIVYIIIYNYVLWTLQYNIDPRIDELWWGGR